MIDEGPTGPQPSPYPPPEDVPELTGQDRAYASIYIQLLDAMAAGADWRLIARDVLKLDPKADAVTSKMSFDRFYARAVWMTEVGYKLLLKSGR